MKSAYLNLIEDMLNQLLPPADARPKALSTAMRWAVEGGGKRLRPLMALAAAEACGGKAQDAIYPACAIEFLHSYTLVHDDLPAMDGDRERRGKASVWAKFGEDVGILTGDALQALAFRTAAKAPRNVARILDVFAARALGVVAGQIEDLGGNDLEFIFQHKTADLFEAAAMMGALAVDAPEKDVAALQDFARAFGFAFQYADDLDDAGADSGGFTSLSNATQDQIREKMHLASSKARDALRALPGDIKLLEAILEPFLG